MKTYFKSAPGSSRTPFAGVLAFVILVCIVSTLAFGSAHSHKDFSCDAGTHSASSTKGSTPALFGLPAHRHIHENLCLICTLHQQLFDSVGDVPLVVVENALTIALVRVPTPFYQSIPITSYPIARLSGRAPPQNRA
jgi:hypothetical protein